MVPAGVGVDDVGDRAGVGVMEVWRLGVGVGVSAMVGCGLDDGELTFP